MKCASLNRCFFVALRPQKQAIIHINATSNRFACNDEACGKSCFTGRESIISTAMG